jgi:hypothetical protein
VQKGPKQDRQNRLRKFGNPTIFNETKGPKQDSHNRRSSSMPEGGEF